MLLNYNSGHPFYCKIEGILQLMGDGSGVNCRNYSTKLMSIFWVFPVICCNEQHLLFNPCGSGWVVADVIRLLGVFANWFFPNHNNFSAWSLTVNSHSSEVLSTIPDGLI